MPLKKNKPITPGSRYATGLDFGDLQDEGPVKSLLGPMGNRAGRGAGGRISVRRRGGRHKRRYRVVDFRRDKAGVPGKVVAVSYDPNRSANLALISYADGDKRYILAPRGLAVGHPVVSGPDAPIEVGNALPLKRIPLGMAVHNVELTLGRGGQMARSAGGRATLVAREGDYVTLRLPSGEVRMVFHECYASIGEVGNQDHMNVSLGKAGRARWLGHRPKVRGVAMNPHDHPHGGGEGKSSGGRHPVSAWGRPTKGAKTRRKRKASDAFIVTRRKGRK
ncbi:MAG: 50S ribosomal protein L2 [Spirochaetaceae bacterium]|nr:50S ribosomal protein L2 [Spirochaetaceae bacterium]MDE0229240.1 50S ribosomal protein L2 [Spirochaetaceae bacterium]